MQLTKDNIINAIRQDFPFIKEKYGVANIGLFGSFAKGTNHHLSDLDFMVELTAPIANNYFGLWDYLEKKI